jgi:uncharacterized BrkB/YihY/UPF0761 family membrane protein
VLGVAVLAAVFASQGDYATPAAFVEGLTPALAIGAATVAMGAVDAVFPLYLSQSTLRLAAGAVFVLIALVWFYVLALILLGGAVVNELRFEARAAARQRTAPALKPRAARPM